MNYRTQIIHAGRDRDPYTGASSIPIYQASTFAQADPERPGAYDYSRSGNPTREALEWAIAELEQGETGLAFASGMAATSSVMMLFQPGDHLVVTNDVYGGTYRALTSLFRQWKLEHTFVDMTDMDAVRDAIQPHTRALFVETPANPLLQISDLAGLAALAQERGLISIIDNTFMTPYLQRPIPFGFDVVIHSATKFLGGHSDVIAGLVVTRDRKLGKRVKAIQNTFGGILGPQDAWLTLRGMKTLAVRMDAQQAGATRIAEWLQQQSDIKHTYFPGSSDHPGAGLHAKQADGPGAVVSFELADKETTLNMLKRIKLSLVAVSLGGIESILSYPACMSHAAMPREERYQRGITDGLLRLSVGLEDPADIIDDMDQAIQAALSQG